MIYIKYKVTVVSHARDSSKKPVKGQVYVANVLNRLISCGLLNHEGLWNVSTVPTEMSIMIGVRFKASLWTLENGGVNLAGT